jgi:hypothetical protein
MKCPEGYSEAEVLEALNGAVNSLASSFRFGYHDLEDMKQEGLLFGLEVLDEEKFDSKHVSGSGLKNFLRYHIRNRYINMKRDKFSRPNSPCQGCLFKCAKKQAESGCAEFSVKCECQKYAGWEKRNTSKRNLMEPCGVNNIRSQAQAATNHKPLDKMERDELVQLVDRHLSVGLRSDYRRMVEGVHLPKRRRIRINEAIRHIFREHYDEDEFEEGQIER